MSSFQEILEKIYAGTGAMPVSHLYELSDLSGQKLDAFWADWETRPAYQRRRLITALMELAEASFQVNFDAIFVQSLDDPDEEVRAVSVEGLWENEQVHLIAPLLAMLRADPSPRVREAAAASLGRYVLAGELEKLDAAIEERIVAELLAAIRREKEVDVRRRAIESAAYAGTPPVLEAIELAYYDEDEAMRRSAVLGMGRSCDQRWASILLAELESHSPAMRYEAALAGGEMMLREAVPLLARLIDDPDRQVCDVSIWALGQIGGAEAKQILLDALEDADEDMQIAIDEALAELALSGGDLDFVLYEVGSLEADDDLVALWTAGAG